MNLVKNPFMQRRTFWLLLSSFSLIGIFFSFRFFSKAFPILDLTITMDRNQALTKAHLLAQQLRLKPENYSQAASFDCESEVQNFIELEAGGPQEFSKILKEGYYSPYFWKVRHFKEYSADEAELFFTPDGKPYGFIQKVAEDEAGAALQSQEAQKIAVDEAQRSWNIDFTSYKIVETAQETTSKGRIDHTFVFERIDKKVGEAPYRLRLVVRGDRLTELKLSVKVPESFEKKYQEMRSSNNFIAFVALIVMIILYVFGGCFFGFYFLARWSWLEFKWPFYWALFIGILQVSNDINQIPFFWFSYDTAVSLQQFIGHIVITIFYHFFTYVCVSFLLIAVAEGLTRRAFPKKVQMWKLWTRQAASSVQLLGRTLGGYLILGIDFAYCIGFYYIALKFFGWWSPSEALYNPNALATYVPWISPIASSLSAGFLEECGFRAIPLAGAALLGDRFGKKKIWIGVAFIVQAIVFGAAHANYPAQPAYARLVELILPSFVFGFLYLRYGLLPAILSHFLFDVFWFSLPIFISHAPGIVFDKIMIIGICLIPLLIVIARRLQQKTWNQLPSSLYNAAWRPRAVAQKASCAPEERVTVYWSKTKKISVVVFGLVGIIFWFAATRFSYDTIPLVINRSDAILSAQKTKAYLDNEGSFLASIEVPLDSKDRNQHLYIWRTFGQDRYKQLLKNYLMPQVFKLRSVRFTGSINERSEEYEQFIEGTKNGPIIRRVHHQYPDNFFLESLSKQEALNEVYEYLLKEYGLRNNDLIEVSAVPTQRPQRTDWKFIFNDARQKLGLGQARVAVEVAGKKVVDAVHSVFVPEQWDRAFKDENAFLSLLEMVKYLLFIILIACGSMIILFCSHAVFTLSLKMVVIIASGLLLKSLIQSFNIWPYASASFNTSEPFNHQMWQVILFWLVYAFFIAVAYGIVAGFMQKKNFKSPQLDAPFLQYGLMGILLGFIDLGFFAFVKSITPRISPLWPSIPHAAAYLPWLGESLSLLTSFIGYTILAFIIFTAVDYLMNLSKQFRWLALPFLMAVGIVMLDVHDYVPWWTMLIIGMVWGMIAWLLYLYAVANLRASIPCMVATVKIFEIIPLIVFNAYPGVLLEGIFGSMLISVLALFWSYQIYCDYNVERSFELSE